MGCSPCGCRVGFTARVSTLGAILEQTRGLTVLGTQSARDSGSGTGLCLGRERDQGLWKETAWSPILPLAWADPSLSQPLSPPQGSSHPLGYGLKGNPLAPGWGGVSAKKELGFLALSWRRASQHIMASAAGRGGGRSGEFLAFEHHSRSSSRPHCTTGTVQH